MDILDKAIKWVLYLLAFLVPLFFLPWTTSPVPLNKQILVVILTFLALILWIIKIITSGKISFNLGIVSKAVLLFLIILGLSTFFSDSIGQSFWGTSVEPDIFFNFILYGLVFFLFTNLIRTYKDGTFKMLLIFLASSGILGILFLAQPIFKIFPWDFTKINGFSPIGSVQALGVFLGGALVILIALFDEIKQRCFKKDFKLPLPKTWCGGKQGRAFFSLSIILGLLLFTIIFLINFWVIWLGIIFGMIIIVIGKLKWQNSKPPHQRRTTAFGTKIGEASPPYGSGGKEKSLVILPLIIIGLSLIFIFIRLPIGNVLNLPIEITPTHKTTFDIGINTLQQSAKDFLFGSGPATFTYQYRFYKPSIINISPFWQTDFSQGRTVLLTFLADLGILGISAVLLMIGLFFYKGFKFLFQRETARFWDSKEKIGLIAFIGGFYFFLSWFFYSANFSLIFAAFLMMGLWNSTIAQKSVKKSKKKTAEEVSFTQSPQKSFFIMLLGVILLAGIVVGAYNIGQKYAAAIYYERGLKQYREELKLDQAITNISKAINFDQKDIYFRDLAQLFLFKTNETLNNQELSEQERQNQLQQNIYNTEILAQRAANINSKDSLNWFHLANIYENLTSLIEGAEQLAIFNYNKSAELDPKNPQIPLNLGRVYTLTAQKIQQNINILEQEEEKDEETIKQLQQLYGKNLDFAQENFKKSLDLKNNFTPAYYLTAQVYEIQEEINLALENYQMVLILEPNNEKVKTRIEELKKALMPSKK